MLCLIFAALVTISKGSDCSHTDDQQECVCEKMAECKGGREPIVYSFNFNEKKIVTECGEIKFEPVEETYEGWEDINDKYQNYNYNSWMPNEDPLIWVENREACLNRKNSDWVITRGCLKEGSYPDPERCWDTVVEDTVVEDTVVEDTVVEDTMEDTVDEEESNILLSPSLNNDLVVNLIIAVSVLALLFMCIVIGFCCYCSKVSKGYRKLTEEKKSKGNPFRTQGELEMEELIIR